MQTYITPQVEVQHITVSQLMASSITIPLGPGIGGDSEHPVMA